MHNGIEHILEILNNPVLTVRNVDPNPLSKEACHARGKQLALSDCCEQGVNSWIQENSYNLNGITASRIRRFYAQERILLGLSSKLNQPQSDVPLPSPSPN